MPHILVAGPIHPAGIAVLAAAPDITLDLIDDAATSAFAQALAKADALLIRTQPLTAAAIAAAPRLKIVSRHGVGYDAVDVPALTARRIPLCIIGDVNARAVAEHTLMMMLACARRAVAYDKAARLGQWQVRNQFGTVELEGKTLLLFGFGRIGRRVTQLAMAFGMTVLASDPIVDASAMAAAGVTKVTDLEAALAQADVVSLHMPMSPGGALITAHHLALMKPSAMIINTARGGLIDEAALDAALRSDRLAAAALDVLVNEPPHADDPLLRNDRVLISPHCASLTRECTERMAISSAQNILDWFSGTLDHRLIVNAA
jgi:D-3-phosphoglycerate dehydrogenase / 2-oxoglutarate reductase